MSNEYAIAIVTVSSKEEAAKIANILLTARLAACIQVAQIQSYYTWQDKINIDDEQLLFIKCKVVDFADLQQCISANHSYEVPEIVQIPIMAGLPAYFQWIDTVTR